MNKKFNLIFWVHLLLILFALSSPFWFGWKFILIGMILLNVQYLSFGGCYLTFLETGKDKHQTFYYHHLSKIFPTLNKKKTWIFVRFFLPVIIFLAAYLLQEKFCTLFPEHLPSMGKRVLTIQLG